jgi:hypothetical protein
MLQQCINHINFLQREPNSCIDILATAGVFGKDNIPNDQRHNYEVQIYNQDLLWVQAISNIIDNKTTYPSYTCMGHYNQVDKFKTEFVRLYQSRLRSPLLDSKSANVIFLKEFDCFMLHETCVEYNSDTTYLPVSILKTCGKIIPKILRIWVSDVSSVGIPTVCILLQNL